MHPERRQELARVAARQLVERDPGLSDEHDHHRAHHPDRDQRRNEELFRLLGLRGRGADQQREYHHEQRLDHPIEDIAGRIVEIEQVVYEEGGRDVADMARTQRAGGQDRHDIQPEQ